jgi:hypothetical protein
MQHYESRTIRPDGALALVSHGTHQSDFSAIRATRKLRKDDELAEVWREGRCVYSECPSHTADLVWPIQRIAARS